MRSAKSPATEISPAVQSNAKSRWRSVAITHGPGDQASANRQPRRSNILHIDVTGGVHVAAGWLGIPGSARHSGPARRHWLGVRAGRDGARWCLHPRHACPAGSDAGGRTDGPHHRPGAGARLRRPPLADEAAELLAAPLHAIGFAFTSSSYVRGAADDE